MIICTEHTLAVGEQVYGPVNDAHLVRHRVAFVVLRETDEDEYRRYAAEHSDLPCPPFDGPMRFYVVSMD